MFDDYWIAIIIITIIGFVLSIALSFYFIFIPSVRAEEQFDVISRRGNEALTAVENLINTSDQLATEIQEDSCESIIYVATKYFAPGGCFANSGIDPCNFIPQFCLQFTTLCPNPPI